MSILPRQDRNYLENQGIAFREVIHNGQKGIILSGITLPAGKYQVGQADILIILPPPYPDVAPDMFYAMPHLTLISANTAPRCTQARLDFDGQNWQRWSRHNNHWRPGIDGIWTMVKRIEVALEVAA